MRKTLTHSLKMVDLLYVATFLAFQRNRYLNLTFNHSYITINLNRNLKGCDAMCTQQALDKIAHELKTEALLLSIWSRNTA